MTTRFSVILTSVAISIVLVWSFVSHGQQKSDASDSGSILVEVSTVKKANIPEEVTSLGSLNASKIVTISSEVDGRISKIYFGNGDKVGTNMPIIQLDDSRAKADYDAAVTALQLSRSKLNRAKLLLNEAISQQEYEQLQADVGTKESNLKIAQATLNQKQIKAPFVGVLGAFKVQQGDYIKPGDALVTLVNTQELEADYNIPEKNLPQLKEGQLIRLVVSAYPNKTFYGTVNFISPTVSDTTRMVSLHAGVDNKNNLLSPGMFIQVTQQIGVSSNVTVVPESAVLADVKGYYVFKIVKNQASQTYITIGDRVGGLVEVIKGLKVGDSVVTAGQQKLQDGSNIQIKNNK